MIVALTNLKGGAGKTTSCMMLATAAARAGYEAHVIDADPQGSSSLWADAAEEEGSPLEFDVRPGNVASVRRLPVDDEAWWFIDLPPAGKVIDSAVSVADLVLIPTPPKPADVLQTWSTIEGLGDVPYAVLLVMVARGRKALDATMDAMRDVPLIETQIPLREGISNQFCHGVGRNLFGYDHVFSEIKEALRG